MSRRAEHLRTEHLRTSEAAPRPVREAPQHLRVVGRRERGPAHRRRRARAVLLASIATVLAVMLALVSLHVVLAQRQIQLDALTVTASADQTRYQELRLQVAEEESPAAIISAAEGRLGMRQPGTVTYVTPPAGATAGTTPAGATPTATTTPTAGQPPTAGRTAGSPAPGATPAPTTAPAGDADWPQIKAELAGRL